MGFQEHTQADEITFRSAFGIMVRYDRGTLTSISGPQLAEKLGKEFGYGKPEQDQFGNSYFSSVSPEGERANAALEGAEFLARVLGLVIENDSEKLTAVTV